MKKLAFSALTLGALAWLAACGGGGGAGPAGTGSLTLKITDAPIDQAQSVLVKFSGVTLKPAEGDEVAITFDAPRTIDLLALQGGAAATLLDGITLPAGQYQWIRLMVEAQRGVLDSYVVLDDSTQRSLFVPSGAQSGLKLVSGFTVPVNASASFTIDFDLRKSITEPQSAGSDYFLKPALRIVDNAQVGAIAGTVAAPTLADASCPSADPALNSNLVYVFAGSGVTPDDIDGAGVEPVTTAAAAVTTGGAFSYRAAFLTPGDYTVAFTCQGADDNPETSQALTFLGARNVTVTTDGTASADF